MKGIYIMFWVILALLAGISISISFLVIEKRETGYLTFSDFFLSFAVALIAIVICLGISIIPNTIVEKCLPESNYEYRVTEEKPLRALKDNIKVSGKFFLGCGSVRGNLTYYYITEDAFGMKLENIPATDNDIRIKYTDNNYCYQYYELTPVSEIAYWFGVPFTDDDIIVFNVPDNSVYEGYEIDLE